MKYVRFLLSTAVLMSASTAASCRHSTNKKGAVLADRTGYPRVTF